MALSNWPTIVDDDGSLTLGTVINKAVFDAIKASVEDDLFSAVNPAITAEDIIDEVVTARGSKASLDARLDVALNEDGTLKTQAGVASVVDTQDSVQQNWCYNEDFLIWAAGDSAAPTGWTLTTITCARAGTGLGDTTTKIGPFCAKLTRAGTNGTLKHSVMNSTSFSASGQHLKGTEFSFGVWLKASVASMVRCYFDDGVGTTVATDEDSNTYHPGDGNWIWFSGTHTISNSATALTLVISQEASNGDCYVSGATVIPGGVPPANWRPCPKVYGAIVWKKAGTASVVAANDRFRFARPALVKEISVDAVTAPTGQALKVDVNHWDGSAFTTMCSTKPEIAAGANYGSAAPDGTYRYRCFTGQGGTGTTITDCLINWDIDQVGSGTAGADLTVTVRAMTYARPQENLLDKADF